jgi:hypothetical protein
MRAPPLLHFQNTTGKHFKVSIPPAMRFTREALRLAYDAAIEEINTARGTSQLTNAFYTKISDSTFDACYRALESSQVTATLPPRLHVVSAPMGTGKTSFAIAFIAALVRLGECSPDAPQCSPDVPRGCVFLVEQKIKADEMYRDLSAMLPGKVAVWTTDHDAACAPKDPKVLKPAARFHVDDLERYPVAIATHAFYKGARGRKARNVAHCGECSPRALTLIDEQTEDVKIFDVTLAGATAVLDAVQKAEQGKELAAPFIRALVRFMVERMPAVGALEKSSDAPEAWGAAASELEWFTTTAAQNYTRANTAIEQLPAVFGFARALVEGYGFIARGTDAPHFMAYQNSLPLTTGMVLLDATADIDGVTQLCPWRVHSQTPQVSYANLEIVHVKSCTRQRLSKFFSHAKNRLAYVDWMKATILAHTEPGQRALVVCKKALFDNCNVPDWNERDERFEMPDVYLKEYGWELGGRKLCATHWGGFGIGTNTWQSADAVFLFDEFHQPRRATIARAQGLMAAKATEGALARMSTLNSKAAPQVDAISEGHLLRWTKQMALRGKGRRFDEHGVCGHQKLICAGAHEGCERLIANAGRLFPGARITNVGDTETTYAEKLTALLSGPNLSDNITTKVVGEYVGVPWAKWGKDVMKRQMTRDCVSSLGWLYAPAKGRAGGRFIRDRNTASLTVH